MGAGGGQPLILAIALAWLVSADPISLHLEPVIAAPSLSGRLDSVFRDSLRARNADLFPLDSLARLQGRQEWPVGEKSPSNLAKLKKLTSRNTIGWVRVDMPNPEFHRWKWFPLLAYREWVLRGEVYRANSDSGLAVDRFSIRKQISLGFVGTWGEEEFPPSSVDVRKAIDELSVEAASRVVQFLIQAAP